MDKPVTKNLQSIAKKLPENVRGLNLPPAITELGDDAIFRFVEFFTARIRNKNTRSAYARAVWKFFTWCPVPLHDINSVHVATWVEELGKQVAPPTVKQHLAAIRMVFDFLIIGQIMPMNPAQAVRGPKHVLKKGETPVLSASQVNGIVALSYSNKNGSKIVRY